MQMTDDRRSSQGADARVTGAREAFLEIIPPAHLVRRRAVPARGRFRAAIRRAWQPVARWDW